MVVAHGLDALVDCIDLVGEGTQPIGVVFELE